MRDNKLRTLWAQGQAAVNGWLAVPNSFSAEVMAHQGWDTLTIDMQHGLIDDAALVPMLQAIQATPTAPVVRVPWLEPSIIMKALDAGAQTLICPMVNTREDAERLAAYARYAPRGGRSFGPVRAGLVHGADYATAANDNVVVFAMIETRQALDNLLSNALRFAPKGTAIHVALAPHEGGWRLSVRDEGPGIPEAQREAVFAPFHRLDRGVFVVGGRRLPARMVLVPVGDEGKRTEMRYLEARFDVALPPDTFSLSRLERSR